MGRFTRKPARAQLLLSETELTDQNVLVAGAEPGTGVLDHAWRCRELACDVLETHRPAKLLVEDGNDVLARLDVRIVENLGDVVDGRNRRLELR